MPSSTANLNTNNLDLGPVRVTFNGTDLGGTLGNANLKFKYDLAPLKVDALGSTEVDHRTSGLHISVETSLAEVLNKDNWKVLFPTGQLITSGSKVVRFIPQMGDSMVNNHAFPLIIHPLNRANADKTSDYLFYKAVASQDSSIVYGPKDQAHMKIVWHIYPDLSQTDYPFCIFGDPAVGLVAASAAAAVAGANTGNGTVSSIAAYSGVTVTETITMTCVTAAANGGVFSVSGSLSGNLGLATVGISFIPSGIGGDKQVISFTINDGSTDFIVGDSFTIATTSSNYS